MDITKTPLEQEAPQQAIVAPAWHVAVLVLLLGLISFSTEHAVNRGSALNHRIVTYIGTMTMEWILLGFSVWGFRRKRWHLREIVGGRWARPEDFLLDVAIAVGFIICAWVTLGGLAYLLGLAKGGSEQLRRTISFVAPHSRPELALGVLTSITAGFVEEILYRGYLQRQFAAYTGRLWLGIIVSAVVFGASHGYEGAGRMVLIAVFGVMFGALATWRRSLRPGMIAHALFDGAQMLLLYAIARGLIPTRP